MVTYRLKYSTICYAYFRMDLRLYCTYKVDTSHKQTLKGKI